MEISAVLFLLINAVALLSLPRRWAPLPLLVGACYMTLAQKIVVGPFNFNILRLLISVGVVRVLFRGERIAGALVGLDRLLLVWGGWVICSAAFHHPASEVLVFRLGVVYNILGIYFLIRHLCPDVESVIILCKMVAITLLPLALEMVLEKATGKNLFSVFGRVQSDVMVRGGKLRAQGPFAHAILAGTVAAACVPLMIVLRRFNPLAARIGLGSCVAMVLASASSGPLMGVFFSVFAMAVWAYRRHVRIFQAVAVLLYLIVEALADRPAYFIITKFDLTGSSTGWHRAELIRSSIAHFGEWWLTGTDYTRHWMPTGVVYSENHTDITSQYIANGVSGGLLQLLLFCSILLLAFRYVGQMAGNSLSNGDDRGYCVWGLGACLFSHAASCVSVAYFDQSFVFLYTTLAAIGSVYGPGGIRLHLDKPQDGDETAADFLVQR